MSSRRKAKTTRGTRPAVHLSFHVEETFETPFDLVDLHRPIQALRLDEALAALDRAEGILASALARLLAGEDPFAAPGDVEVRPLLRARAELSRAADGRFRVAFDRAFARCIAKGMGEDVADALRAWMAGVHERRLHRKFLAESLRDELGEADWRMSALDAMKKHGDWLTGGSEDDLVEQAVQDVMEGFETGPQGGRLLH